MIPRGFDYHDPTSPEEVLALLGEYGDEGKLMAGGQSLLPRMSWPLLSSARVVAAMSSCNALPVIMEISPTTIAGCIEKRSCNASEVTLGLSSSL